MDNDWKIKQEMSRLQLDIENLERVVNNRLRRIKNRYDTIQQLLKEKPNTDKQTKMFE